MAYLALLWKARTIEKYRLKYEKEKINSILANNKELPKNTLYQKWTLYRNHSQKRLGRILRVWCPEGSKMANGCSFLKDNISFLLQIVIGIVGGIVLMYCLYEVFRFEVRIWTVTSWIIGVAITLGVVFNRGIRCLVLLLIPGLFSRVGRYTLACYALVLILTGPATNTLKNLDTLSESLACGQEQIKSSVKQLKESEDSPLNLVKGTMSGTVDRIQYLAGKMKRMMVAIHRLTMSIAHVLQSSLAWLNSVETVCNTKLGTPYEHCAKTLTQGAKKCEKEFPETSLMLNWDVFIRAICFNLNEADPLCVVGDFAKGSILATVKKKLNTYSNHIQSLLYMAVHIRRSHSCCSNGSLPVCQAAAAGIVTELRIRADPLLTWLSWSCTLTGLFLLLIIFRAKYYQHMFRTRSRFDNRYVTKEFRELDLKRQRQGRETVLPLNTRERAKYVSAASTRLLPSERMYLTRSIVFMVISTLKLLIHMVADYSLYWVLMNIRFYGSAQDNSRPSDRAARFLVSDSGPLSAIVRMLVEALSVPLAHPAPSPTSCLPDPNPPDLQRYAQIGTLILLLWLLALFEPYGLRLRHVITGHYQPERAKARAVWLYYHIIRTRSCFLKYARRKLHRQYKYTSEEKFTFKKWLNDCIPFRWLRTLLGVGPEEPHCLLCYTKHRQDDVDRHLKSCESSSCPGVYCARCFMDIGQLCTICYSPEDYGDLSDVSLEKHTSDDSESDNTDNDDDDDFKGDHKPLMGSPAYEMNDEIGTHSKLMKKSKYNRFLGRRNNNDNQESKPLLDCDYLNTDYYQKEKPFRKNENILNLQERNQFSIQNLKMALKLCYQGKEKSIVSKNIQSKILLPTFDERPTFPPIFGEAEVIGKAIPKEKLPAIIKTMMLLTKNVNDEEYDKCNNKIKPKPFEYLIMEMFQLLEIFKKVSIAEHPKYQNIQNHVGTEEISQSFKKKIPCLVNNLVVPEKLSSTTALSRKDSPTEYNNSKKSKPIVKNIHDHDNSQKKNESKKLSRRDRNLWSTKRNVKRYLEVKKITCDLIKRLRKRRINYNSRQFRKRRRRSIKRTHLSFIAIVIKVFSKKTAEVDKSGPLDDTLNKDVKTNKVPNKMKQTVKQRKQALPNTSFTKKEKYVYQETECCLRKNAHSLRNAATGGTIDKKSANEMNNGNSSKETNEINYIGTDQKPDGKTTELQLMETKNKGQGFWASLCLSRRGHHSNRTYASIPKDEPLSNKLVANHKRRKKRRTKNRTEANQKNLEGRKVNDDARNYRIALFLKDHEWFPKMAKCDNIRHRYIKDSETVLELDSKTYKNVARKKERLKKEKMKNMQREIKSKHSNEYVKTQEREGNAKPLEETRSHTGNKRTDGTIPKFVAKGYRYFIEQIRSTHWDFVHPDTTKKLHDFGEINYDNYFRSTKWKPNEEIENAKTFDPPYSPNKVTSTQDIYKEETGDTAPSSQSEIASSVHREITENFCSDHTVKKVTDESHCCHIWHMEPKKYEETQTAGSHGKDIDGTDALQRCFQTIVNKKIEGNNRDVPAQSSDQSIFNTKQIQFSCNRKKKDEENTTKSRVAEENYKEVTPTPLVNGKSRKELKWIQQMAFYIHKCVCEANRKKEVAELKRSIAGFDEVNSEIECENCRNTKSKPKKECKWCSTQAQVIYKEETINIAPRSQCNISPSVNESSTATLNPDNTAESKSSYCSHVWHMEPKKRHEISQTAGSDEENINRRDALQRCFQITIKPGNAENSRDKQAQSSDQSMMNSKRTQLRTVCSRKKKDNKEYNIRAREDKEVNAYPDQKTRGCQYEELWQQTQQAHPCRCHDVKHIETQYFPALICPVHSFAVETEKTQMRTCASQYSSPAHTDNFLNYVEVPYVSVEYTNEKPKKVKSKKRVHLTTTTDRSTTTETKTLADVSTLTSDWWSPLVEKKDIYKKPEEKAQENVQEYKNKKTAPDQDPGSLLKVKQRHPEEATSDILSPSKYLLQSEKYYNQIYALEMGSSLSSHNVSLLLKKNDFDRSTLRLRKGHRTKRLEECYSPRKKMQSSAVNLKPPKWRPAVTEEQAHALKYYRRRSNMNMQPNQKLSKLKHNKERYGSTQSSL